MSNLDIKEIRRSLKLTQTELAEKLGVHYKTIQNWEKGGTIPESKKILLRKFGIIPGGNTSDYDELIRQLNPDKFLVNEAEMEYITAWLSNQVHLLPLSARALEITPDHFQQFGASYEKVLSPIKDADFATVLSGDGLGMEFPDGAIVFFKRIDPDLFIEWGKVHAVSTKNGLIIKRLNESPEPGRLICSGADPRFNSFEIPKNGPDMYFYKAIACFSIK